MQRMFCFILIATGDILMFFTAIRYSRLIKQILQETDHRERFVRAMLVSLRVLPFFFFVGYTLAMLDVLLRPVTPIYLLVAVVFFFGAIFVAAVVQIQIISSGHLRERNERLRQSQEIIANHNENLQAQIEEHLVEITHQDVLLNDTNTVAAMLLAAEGKDFAATMAACMKMMADGVDVDRIQIWHNQKNGDNLYHELLFDWSREGEAVHASMPRRNTLLKSLPQWETLFADNKSVNGIVRTFSQEERDYLVPYDICSLLVIPVFLQDTLWGFVNFDDCRQERDFSESEENILRSASLLFVSAIVRNENESMLSKRFIQQEAMSRISRSFIARRDMADRINAALLEVGTLLEVDRVLVTVLGRDDRENQETYTWSRSGAIPVSPHGMGRNKLSPPNFPDTIAAGKIANSIYCNDTRSEPAYAAFDEMGVSAFVWAPLYVEEQYWGVLSVEDSGDNRTWTESDKQLINMASSALAGAVTRNRIEKERAAALEQAVQASKAKSDFLSNMSHEMRTPMNAIIGMTAIGWGAETIDRKNYAFEKIEGASNHMLGVINDILDMSKIEANKMELSYTEFSFEAMLRKVINVVRFRAEEKRQDLTVYIDSRISTHLIGDDQRLAQVLANLLSNAVKFTPDRGTILVDTCLIEDKDESCTLRIKVVDSGIGISKEQQERLFTSFGQAESSTSRKFGGTGLGLAISKSIVEMMNGRIWIESTLGEGAAFIVEVEMGQGLRDNESPINSYIGSAGLRLLVVDSAPRTRDYFRELAGQWGIACDTAGNMPEAKALLANGSYSMCFIEWDSADEAGAELAHFIRQEYGPEIPIIIMSAAEKTFFETNIDGVDLRRFLSKPVFPSEIAAAINDCFSGQAPASTKENTGEQNSFAGYRVLLAEDVELNKEIVLALLAPTMLEVDWAENGRVALEMYKAAPEQYDMIFMDVQMPDMDGYEATRQIRALEVPRAKWVPIVAMTANVFREDVERCMEAGMDDHLGKPLDFAEVMQKLHRFLIEKPALSDVEKPWEQGLVWRPEYETGDAAIDSQHKQLFVLTRNVIEACVAGQNTYMLSQALDFLAEYAVRHFADEEALQVQYNYYDYQNHKKLHEAFAEKVGGLIAEYKAGGSTEKLRNNVHSIIVRWLVQHIQGEDTKIAAYVRRLQDLAEAGEREEQS